ncbi:hypothetical protein [Deinococcus altitudinis]|uniref:hypothetical protein n=1 Tax=Deinococcus altitudinis TaxID=468914 RepID=UPI003891B802
MRTDMEWEAALNRLENSRQEASTRRLLGNLLGNRAHVNLWARLLPPLRRLEGWIERHAGTAQQGSVHTRAAGTR